MPDGTAGRFENKVALIAGGANAVEGRLMGFGGVCAWRILREGGRVVIGDIEDATGEEAVSQMQKAGFEAEYRHLDVTSESDWQEIVKLVVDSFGSLDVLINAAGTQDKESIEKTSVDDWTRTMDVTNRMMFLGTRAVAPEMRKAGGGSIVNISSISGMVGQDNIHPGYNASKGAVRLLTKSTAIQHAKDGIRANSVHPGPIATPMTEAGRADPERYQRSMSRTPLGRYGEPDDVAFGVLFLASDESSYMTGSELVIDGGVTAQ